MYNVSQPQAPSASKLWKAVSLNTPAPNSSVSWMGCSVHIAAARSRCSHCRKAWPPTTADQRQCTSVVQRSARSGTSSEYRIKRRALLIIAKAVAQDAQGGKGGRGRRPVARRRRHIRTHDVVVCRNGGQRRQAGARREAVHAHISRSQCGMKNSVLPPGGTYRTGRASGSGLSRAPRAHWGLARCVRAAGSSRSRGSP